MKILLSIIISGVVCGYPAYRKGKKVGINMVLDDICQPYGTAMSVIKRENGMAYAVVTEFKGQEITIKEVKKNI